MRALLPFADSADPATRQAALFALANIGDPAAGPVLSRSRVAAPFRERAQAPTLYLLYARRLLESGRTAEGLEAARSVLEHYQRPEEVSHASAALALVVEGLGERALPDLLAAATSPDRKLRGAALALSPSMPGSAVTARWLEKGAASPPTSAPTSSTCWGTAATPRPCPSSGRASGARTLPSGGRPSRPSPGWGATRPCPIS